LSAGTTNDSETTGRSGSGAAYAAGQGGSVAVGDAVDETEEGEAEGDDGEADGVAGRGDGVGRADPEPSVHAASAQSATRAAAARAASGRRVMRGR
jgi:hypothetical protein